MLISGYKTTPIKYSYCNKSGSTIKYPSYNVKTLKSKNSNITFGGLFSLFKKPISNDKITFEPTKDVLGQYNAIYNGKPYTGKAIQKSKDGSMTEFEYKNGKIMISRHKSGNNQFEWGKSFNYSDDGKLLTSQKYYENNGKPITEGTTYSETGFSTIRDTYQGYTPLIEIENSSKQEDGTIVTKRLININNKTQVQVIKAMLDNAGKMNKTTHEIQEYKPKIEDIKNPEKGYEKVKLWRL